MATSAVKKSGKREILKNEITNIHFEKSDDFFFAENLRSERCRSVEVYERSGNERTEKEGEVRRKAANHR